MPPWVATLAPSLKRKKSSVSEVLTVPRFCTMKGVCHPLGPPSVLVMFGRYTVNVGPGGVTGGGFSEHPGTKPLLHDGGGAVEIGWPFGVSAALTVSAPLTVTFCDVSV